MKPFVDNEWMGLSGNEIVSQLHELNEARALGYKKLTRQIDADANVVETFFESDYRDRQIVELIQNGADQMSPERFSGEHDGRIKILLTPRALYCANQGKPFTFKGFEAISYAMGSDKEDADGVVGQFGNGFRSVLGVTDTPEIISRPCSVRFSRQEAAEYFSSKLDRRIERVNPLAYFIPVDPSDLAADDQELRDLMSWATTVIRLPLRQSKKTSGIFSGLQTLMRAFAPEFLLFCPHVTSIEFSIHDDAGGNSSWSYSTGSSVVEVVEGNRSIRLATIVDSRTPEEESSWIVSTRHDIKVPDDVGGVSRNRKRDDEGELKPVSVSWAVDPTNAANERGAFWVFFPTKDETTLRGLVNGRFDTDAGRTKVQEPLGAEPNLYNQLLLDEVAKLVLWSLPQLAARFPDDPGRYLELLPARGKEESNAASRYLVESIWGTSTGFESIPDLDGNFRRGSELSGYPKELGHGDRAVNLAETWVSLGPSRRNFPHPSTLKNTGRRASVARLLAGGAEVDS